MILQNSCSRCAPIMNISAVKHFDPAIVGMCAWCGETRPIAYVFYAEPEQLPFPGPAVDGENADEPDESFIAATASLNPQPPVGVELIQVWDRAEALWHTLGGRRVMTG